METISAFLKRKMKIIIIISILFSFLISAGLVYLPKEKYTATNVYIIDYGEHAKITEQNEEKIKKIVDESINRAKKELTVELQGVQDYSGCTDIITAVLHGDQMYTEIVNKADLSISKSEYDSMITEDYSGNGMVVSVAINSSNSDYCEKISENIGEIFNKECKKYFDTTLKEVKKADKTEFAEKSKTFMGELKQQAKYMIPLCIAIAIGLFLVCCIIFYTRAFKDGK